jgi:hypothetical protein
MIFSPMIDKLTKAESKRKLQKKGDISIDTPFPEKKSRGMNSDKDKQQLIGFDKHRLHTYPTLFIGVRSLRFLAIGIVGFMDNED